MELLTDMACLEQSSFDIAYVTEIDPLWQDDVLTALINPEVALFANPIAQVACAADCGAATSRRGLHCRVSPTSSTDKELHGERWGARGSAANI